MHRSLVAIPLLVAACGNGDLRVVGTDDGTHEGSRVFAQLADIEENEAIDTQQARVKDGAFEFLFEGAAREADALALIVQVEIVRGSGCGPSVTEELDKVQVGAVEVDTADFLSTVCLGAPTEETSGSSDE